MHITMVKKRLADGNECRKCQDASSMLQSKGLWEQVDQVIWAREDDSQSEGMVLGAKLGVTLAPFFVVRDDTGHERVYTSVLQLMRECLRQEVSAVQQAVSIDADDVGGI